MKLQVSLSRVGYQKKTILKDVSFSADSGTFTAVIGRNGSGKSTLLSCLAGTLPYEGTLLLGETELSSLSGRVHAQKIARMAQSLQTPHITVRELVAFGRNPYLAPGQKPGEKDHAIVTQALFDADLCDLADCYLDRISGGEVRRAYLGMILAQDTPVILLDEATAFLDAEYEAHFLSLLSRLHKELQKTILFVMHNLEHAVAYADNIVYLADGTCAFFGTTREFLATTLPEDGFSLRRFYAADGEETRVFFAAR